MSEQKAFCITAESKPKTKGENYAWYHLCNYGCRKRNSGMLWQKLSLRFHKEVKPYDQKNVPLKEVATAGIGPSSSGVYILSLYGKVMKVGSAKIRIQKRMQQYYNPNPHCELNCHITPSNRDRIEITYQICPINACEELKSKLFDKYGPLSDLLWAMRHPHCTKNIHPLYI